MDNTPKTEVVFGKSRQLVRVPVDHVHVDGELTLPVGTQAIVVFAHGSGSSRHSPRNQHVAAVIQQEGVATLLLDLLTREEEDIDVITREFRFDIELLARRLMATCQWLQNNPDTSNLRIGLFGASTGAGAALMTAARAPECVQAVVSRGGRPDLAGDELKKVKAPTLLIVGGNDTQVISLNRDALEQIPAEKALRIIPGATHLFEEPGTLDEVARQATEWFVLHLRSPKCP